MRNQSGLQVLPVDQRTLADGNIVLFHRENTICWFARLKLQGKWVVVSTGSDDIDEAKAVALTKYHGKLNPSSSPQKQFCSVAQLTIKEIRSSIANGEGKACFQNYIDAINKYLIPCFTTTLIDAIGYDELARLDVFRIAKLGHKPKRSTVATHNTALHLVFETAINKGLMTASGIPSLHNKGTRTQARPFFTKDELAQLASHLEAFTTIGKKSSTFVIRELVRDYALILIRTGMRTGREALGLKWNLISQITLPDGRKGLSFSVDGKTGKRTLICQDDDGMVTACLIRIASRSDELKGKTLTDLMKVNAFVFTYEGSKVKHGRIAANFKECLVLNGMLKNMHGEVRSLYSLRHSYATYQILSGVDMATLAVQMGTSIAMLEKHYSKLKPYMKASILHGAGIPSETRLEKLVSEQSAMIQALLGKLSERVN